MQKAALGHLNFCHTSDLLISQKFEKNHRKRENKKKFNEYFFMK